MKEKLQKRAERFSDTMHLPGDILAGASILTVMGQRELYLENYRNIIEYTGELLRIQTKTGRIHIEGKQLKIEYYTEDTMKVSGVILKISYGKFKTKNEE